MDNLKVSMTGQDILTYLPNCKIIEYNDLETDDLGLISPVHWPS